MSYNKCLFKLKHLIYKKLNASGSVILLPLNYDRDWVFVLKKKILFDFLSQFTKNKIERMSNEFVLFTINEKINTIKKQKSIFIFAKFYFSIF
jgi:hypothetical protein